MNKNGWSYLSIILGAFVILLMAALITNVGVPYAQQKFLGERGILSKIPPEKEFVPSVIKLFPEEESVLNSMNALSCAINNIVLGDYRFEEACAGVPSTLEKPSIDLSGTSACDVRFGDKCVLCGSSEYVRKPLSKQKEAALKEIAEAAVNCQRNWEAHNKQPRWCYQFIVPQDFEGTITESDFRDVLFKYGGSEGSNIAGWDSGILGKLGDNYEWYNDVNSGIGSLSLCADDFWTGTFQIKSFSGKTFGQVCKKSKEQLAQEKLGMECGVSGFTLPQKVDTGYFDPAGWISAYGDPKWIAYYEAFPQGEEEAWQIDPLEVGLYASAVFNIVTFIPFGAVAGKIAQKSEKLLAPIKRLLGWTLNTIPGIKLVAFLGKAGYQYARITIIAPINIVRKILAGGLEYAGRAGEKILVKFKPEYYVKLFGDANSILTKIDAKDLKKVMDELSFENFKALDNLAKNIYSIDNEAPKILAAFKKLNPTVLKTAFTESEQKLIQDAVEASDHKKLLDIIQSMEANQQQGVAEMMFGKHDAALLFEVNKAQRFIDVQEQILQHTSVDAAANTFLDKVRTLGRGIDKVIEKKGKGYTLGLAAGLVARLADSKDEKFLPVGSNELAIKTPYRTPLVSRDAFLGLIPEANKYNVILVRDISETFGIGTQKPERFFLASPCKANLQIFTTNCQCSSDDKLKEQNEIFNFGAGPIPVFKPSLNTLTLKPDKRYAYAIKSCSALADFTNTATAIKSDVFASPCIAVVPSVIDNTFCYSGIHVFAEIGKWTVVGGNIAASVAAEVAADVVGLGTAGIGYLPAKGVQYVLNVGFDVTAALLEHWLTEYAKWPHH